MALACLQNLARGVVAGDVDGPLRSVLHGAERVLRPTLSEDVGDAAYAYAMGERPTRPGRTRRCRVGCEEPHLAAAGWCGASGQRHVAPLTAVRLAVDRDTRYAADRLEWYASEARTAGVRGLEALGHTGIDVAEGVLNPRTRAEFFRFVGREARTHAPGRTDMPATTDGDRDLGADTLSLRVNLGCGRRQAYAAGITDQCFGRGGTCANSRQEWRDSHAGTDVHKWRPTFSTRRFAFAGYTGGAGGAYSSSAF
jgi:hypothetical protein